MGRETILETVERHIREGEFHIARQQEVIEELRRGGHCTRAAESLLDVFKQTLASHRDHAKRLRLPG